MSEPSAQKHEVIKPIPGKNLVKKNLASLMSLSVIS